MTIPPGWYRDPADTRQERWWDGTGWTEHRRAPREPHRPPVPDGTGRARTTALISACAVLVVAIVTGVSALDQGGGAVGGDPRAEDARSAPPSAPSSAPGSAAPSPSAPSVSPAPAPSYVVDELNGITLPLLPGWVPARNVTEADAVMTTDGVYDCPGDPGFCHHGLVISRTATGTGGTSVKALAARDIADAAQEAYGRDALGARPFGGMTSHRLVSSGPVAVAGTTGYYVRWRIRTADGPGGYVQSLAFRSRRGTRAPVVLRYAFDAGPDGPAPTDMDRITKGIRPAG